MGVLCFKIGVDLGIINFDSWKFLWVVDFLMFEEDDEGILYVVYYLFIVLKGIFFEEFEVNLVGVLLDVYDMVLNGYEVGGGLVCIYNVEM